MRGKEASLLIKTMISYLSRVEEYHWAEIVPGKLCTFIIFYLNFLCKQVGVWMGSVGVWGCEFWLALISVESWGPFGGQNSFLNLVGVKQFAWERINEVGFWSVSRGVPKHITSCGPVLLWNLCPYIELPPFNLCAEV